jgi:hypothetical protein
MFTGMLSGQRVLHERCIARALACLVGRMYIHACGCCDHAAKVAVPHAGSAAAITVQQPAQIQQVSVVGPLLHGHCSCAWNHLVHDSVSVNWHLRIFSHVCCQRAVMIWQLQGAALTLITAAALAAAGG